MHTPSEDTMRLPWTLEKDGAVRDAAELAVGLRGDDLRSAVPHRRHRRRGAAWSRALGRPTAGRVLFFS